MITFKPFFAIAIQKGKLPIKEDGERPLSENRLVLNGNRKNIDDEET